MKKCQKNYDNYCINCVSMKYRIFNGHYGGRYLRECCFCLELAHIVRNKVNKEEKTLFNFCRTVRYYHPNCSHYKYTSSPDRKPKSWWGRFWLPYPEWDIAEAESLWWHRKVRE